MLTGLAHAAICVPDIAAAVEWYSQTLGLTVLSPPYRMEGAEIERDMGELIPFPVVVTAAIVGIGPDDHVIELIEYPEADTGSAPPGAAPTSIVRTGLTHIGITCDDIETTTERLVARGVTFLTSGIADVAGLRTTWFTDPWGTVFILLEKRRPGRPYWSQLGS